MNEDKNKESEKSTVKIANDARYLAIKWLKNNYPDSSVKEVIKGRFKYIIVEKGNDRHYYIVKGTEESNGNFGAVTVTALRIVLEHYNNSHFLLINITNDKPPYSVQQIEVDNMLKIMSIPPFKIFFNIHKRNEVMGENMSDKGVKIEDVQNLIMYYGKIKDNSI